MSSLTRADVARVIATERKCARRYTWLLWTRWNASRATRARWKALRAKHRGYVADWKEKTR